MGSEFLLFPSTGVVGFLPHSIALPVNKPDERAGRFLAPLLEVVNGLKSSKLVSCFDVWAVRICYAHHAFFRPIGLQSIEERERLR